MFAKPRTCKQVIGKLLDGGIRPLLADCRLESADLFRSRRQTAEIEIHPPSDHSGVRFGRWGDVLRFEPRQNESIEVAFHPRSILHHRKIRPLYRFEGPEVQTLPAKH